MAARNAAVKPAPQRWQEERDLKVDVAVTFEGRVMEAVVSDMSSRGSAGGGGGGGAGTRPLLVLNLEVPDTPADAATAAPPGGLAQAV